MIKNASFIFIALTTESFLFLTTGGARRKMAVTGNGTGRRNVTSLTGSPCLAPNQTNKSPEKTNPEAPHQILKVYRELLDPTDHTLIKRPSKPTPIHRMYMKDILKCVCPCGYQQGYYQKHS